MVSLTDCWLCTSLRLEYQRIIDRHYVRTFTGGDPAEWVRCPQHAEEHEDRAIAESRTQSRLTITAPDGSPRISNRGDK